MEIQLNAEMLKKIESKIHIPEKLQALYYNKLLK